MVLEFMAALYNEAPQVRSLFEHVEAYVHRFVIIDDGSTDGTGFVVGANIPSHTEFHYEYIEHTGLPETVKARALESVHDDSWVIMLDADERFGPGVLEQIWNFYTSEESKDITHVWFTLQEYIDGQATRQFQKCRLFRASSAHFSTRVHEDDTFDGNGAFFGWTVIHSKSKEKQIKREHEYIETYKRLVAEGKITEDRMNEMKSFHYFVK